MTQIAQRRPASRGTDLPRDIKWNRTVVPGAGPAAGGVQRLGQLNSSQLLCDQRRLLDAVDDAGFPPRSGQASMSAL